MLLSAALSCPLLIAAAQTLCDFTIQPGNQNNPNGILRWPKKLSQKSMKARKSKLIEKPPERNGTVVSSLELNSSIKNNSHVRKDSAAEHNHNHHHNHHHHPPKPSKRLKLSTMENKKGSFPSSSSSAAIESDRKHSSSSSSKFRNHSRMMMPPPPPPKRTLQKSSTYPQKALKFPWTGWKTSAVDPYKPILMTRKTGGDNNHVVGVVCKYDEWVCHGVR